MHTAVMPCPELREYGSGLLHCRYEPVARLLEVDAEVGTNRHVINLAHGCTSFAQSASQESLVVDCL